VSRLVQEIEALPEEEGEDGFVPKRLDTSDYVRYELPPQTNREYICSWDLGTSATKHHGRNATVGFVLDITQKPWRIVGYRRETQASYPMIINWVKEWDDKYKNRGLSTAHTVIDATGSGNPVEQILQEEHNLDVDGFSFSPSSKPDVINAGQVCLDRGWLVMPPIRQVVDEFSSYEIHDRKIVQDCVMGLCVGLHRARQRAGDHASQSTGNFPTRTGSRTFVSQTELEDFNEMRHTIRRELARSTRTNRSRR
jgi:hypothetical protein